MDAWNGYGVLAAADSRTLFDLGGRVQNVSVKDGVLHLGMVVEAGSLPGFRELRAPLPVDVDREEVLSRFEEGEPVRWIRMQLRDAVSNRYGEAFNTVYFDSGKSLELGAGIY